MELKKWKTNFQDTEDVIYNMFNFYVGFMKSKEHSIRKMNHTSNEFMYMYKGKFDYENLTVTIVLEQISKNE